jgi:hypothetical protein
MSIFADELAVRMLATRERTRNLRMQAHEPAAAENGAPAGETVNLPQLVQELTQLVELAERAWAEALALLNKDALSDYQVVGECLQDLFANVFTGLANISSESSGTPGVPAEARANLANLQERMSRLVNALDRTWPWLNNQAGLFDPADLQAAVEEHRRGEFADLKEFARDVAGEGQ